MAHLISSTHLLQTARQNGYGITAFNVHTLEMLQAVVEAAEELQAPLILQTTVGTVKHLGPDYIVAAASAAAKRSSVPIALHLDHCTDYELIVQCIREGYTSVMIDASMHPFEDNVRQTQDVVKVARAAGVNVEAELGKVGGVEDDIVVADEDALLADPDECVRFVELTGVPTLAPAIGTAHGIYKGEPKIAFGKLEEIYRKVSLPLVLHGGSGIPEEQVKRCVSLGMAKMNVATELRIAFSDAIKKVFQANPDENDPRKYMVPAKAAVKELAQAKMRLTGCVGRAEDFR
ncbi:class II fructose-1,6-bisphosphate aldolase [Paenibacillus sp. UNC499MF]|uniref:class II fructose-1,6-bisphosphate aldolase n=1 Tax=Paenibacillus sp. UNC499MF TaxID=1502751 RepID=UPI0008A0685E|nr:class II fructose-1,6-bisphosphate aldolase [Paenibacillus sp. UNC499MF]SEG73268.1 tagatose 1,6-diphosphate aldolase GatY/KbaY [Paenibacillus sp. UNC499MF]